MQLAQAFNNVTTTTNGAVAFKSTTNACLDFFFQAGASRGKDISKLFKAAVAENEEVAVRTLLWLRDAREGAGERQQFKNLVLSLNNEVVERIIPMIPELGRWDDLLVFLDTPHERQAAGVIAAGLNMGNGLCAKWMPRQGEKAGKLRKILGIPSPKMWRKLLVSLSDTVEQKMCAKQWEEIDFNKVPSVAAGRYIQAFLRNAPVSYTKYKEALVKGEKGVKINAGAVYPYNVVQACRRGNADIADAQWKALPDYMEGVTDRILPVVDVSGSMGCPAGGYGSKSEVTCMDVAVSLGIYTAQRNVGAFKNVFMTFSESPQLQVFDDTKLSTAISQLERSQWGMSTNIEKVFTELLARAKLHSVPEEEMPTKVIIFSDMQFNACITGSKSVSAFNSIRATYAAEGYKLPEVVFWNINSQAGNAPVLRSETGVALVSGFSPSIMQSLLKGSLAPESVMLDTVMKERYAY